MKPAIVILLLVLAMMSYREDKLQMLGIFSFSERKRALPPSTEISVLAFMGKKVQCFPGVYFKGICDICFISQWMKRSKHGLFIFPPRKTLI